jgi:hypothetical protein
MPWSVSDHPSNIVQLFTSFLPGFRLIDGTDLFDMSHLLFSAKENIRADSSSGSSSTAGNWGTAVWGIAVWGGTGVAIGTVPLQTYISQITDATAVMLPPGIPGRYVQVINDTGSSLEIVPWPYNELTQMADTIAPAGSSFQATSVFQAPGDIAEYVCFAAGLWKQSSGGAGGGPGGGFPDAPVNGVTYGRLNGGWVPVMGVSGGTLVGPLILPPGIPTNPNQAITLSFVQNTVANLSIDEGTY